MKENSKRCWSCGHFHAYYTSGYCCLLKENNGYCQLLKEVKDKSDGCENWHSRQLSLRRRKIIAVRAIPEIYKKVAIIEQILLEDAELQEIKKNCESCE